MRVCEDLSEEQEERMVSAARQILATVDRDWLEFSDSPGEMSEEFLYARLGVLGIPVDEDKKRQMRRCLFRHLALEDNRITSEDEDVLRSLCQAHRSDDSLLPGQSGYFEKLIAVVKAGFPGRVLSFIRIQRLAVALSQFIVQVWR